MGDYNLNGYLVQSGLHPWIIEDNSVYRGLGCGQPWPLDNLDLMDNDPTAALFTKMTEEYFHGFVADPLIIDVMPDIGFVNRYAAYCSTLGISTRILLAASKLEFPLVDSIDPTKLFLLGFDYTPNSFGFPLLADDLSGPEIPELSEFRGRLNKYGLFDDPNDCAAYIERRRRLLEQGMNLEIDDDCTQFKVYEVVRHK